MEALTISTTHITAMKPIRKGRLELIIEEDAHLFEGQSPKAPCVEIKQCVQDSLGNLRLMVDDETIVSKGEFVVVVTGSSKQPTSSVETDRLLKALAEKLSAKDAAKVAAQVTGLKRNALYGRLLELK